MTKEKQPVFPMELRRQCTLLVYEVAKKYEVPPVLITAHTRHYKASVARREVMTTMICEYGMRRWQVACAFGRDLRRVRKSVIGA